MAIGLARIHENHRCASRRAIAQAMLLIITGSFVVDSAVAESVKDLLRLSIEELSNVEVTSVSRRPELVGEAASAVHVITAEDIRRSGVRSIPEALRLAPNLQVAQTGSRSWAISARGFNAPFSNKLLVLLDGRTVYSPLFSGVFWDVQDTLLHDIERIEVISGPGATVWGANAVNGVINVISKRASDTQDLLITAGSGTEERAMAGLRYGGAAGQDLHYRVYARYVDRDDTVLADGTDAGDSGSMAQAGFRIDRDEDRSQLTLQGDVYDASGEQMASDDVSLSGGNLRARWSHQGTQGEQLQIQAYYDRTRQFAPGDFGDELTTWDLDIQYGRPLGERQHLMLGTAYRFTHNSVKNLPGSIAFLPATLDRHLFSAFIQDTISFFDDRLKVTLGSKFEHNDYTGFEIQPSARAAWTSGQNVLWAAVSRAVRSPSRIDRDLFFPAQPPYIFGGGPDFQSEEVIAYEAGWRVRPHVDVSFSSTAFYSDYDDIRSLSLGPPFVTRNDAEGEIYGLEWEGAWQLADCCRLAAGYTLLQEDLRVKPGRADLNAGQGEAFDPQQQAQLRISVDVTQDLELDAWFRYTDRIANSARGFRPVPDYTTLDVRVGWLATDRLELSIVGQNLLDERHAEFGFREIERSGYAKATWRF